MDTKVIQVEDYVFEKVKKSDVKFHIPLKPIFYQEYNHRVIVGLFPQYATWGDGEVCFMKVVKLTSKNILTTNVNLDPKSISDILSRACVKNKSLEDNLKQSVIDYLQNFPEDDRITKDVFQSRLNNFTTSLNKLL